VGGFSATSWRGGKKRPIFIYIPVERSQLVLVNNAILQQGDNIVRGDSQWPELRHLRMEGVYPSLKLLNRGAERRSHDSSWPFGVVYRDKYFCLQF